MPMPDSLRKWLRLGEIRVQVMPMLFFSLGGRPVNKKTPRERPLSRWQRFRRAPDSPRELVMWPSSNLCIVLLPVGLR
jgi:hypothetical protein